MMGDKVTRISHISIVNNSAGQSTFQFIADTGNTISVPIYMWGPTGKIRRVIKHQSDLETEAKKVLNDYELEYEHGNGLAVSTWEKVDEVII